jgi:SsrA-binding protein
MARASTSVRTIALNRRARHQYEILDEVVCGIALVGSEVKSLRAGRASIDEAYGLIRGGELWLLKVHVPEYPQAGPMNHVPDRERKLLVHRREIERWSKAVREKGVTLVPLELRLEGHLMKVVLALVRGKKLHDKRETAKERDAERDMRRALGRRR